MPLVAGQLDKAYFPEKASLEKLTEVGLPNIDPQRVSRPGTFLRGCSKGWGSLEAEMRSNLTDF